MWKLQSRQPCNALTLSVYVKKYVCFWRELKVLGLHWFFFYKSFLDKTAAKGLCSKLPPRRWWQTRGHTYGVYPPSLVNGQVNSSKTSVLSVFQWHGSFLIKCIALSAFKGSFLWGWGGRRFKIDFHKWHPDKFLPHLVFYIYICLSVRTLLCRRQHLPKIYIVLYSH